MSTREDVLRLRKTGYPASAIAEALRLSKSTVSYHLQRAGEAPDERFGRRYDWQAVQRYYDDGHSVTECQHQFGFSRGSWWSARKRGLLRARTNGMPLEMLMAAPRNRSHLKGRLVRAGLLAPECGLCGIAVWRGRPLTLALHHVNGIGDDNRLENLELLCPNCHSQTETFAGRNARRRRLAREAESSAA